jgi:hypothetical protein
MTALPYICDCGQHYSSLAAVEACQSNNHGKPRPRGIETVFLEIRDEGTCIPALAIKMRSEIPVEDRFLCREGYPRGERRPAVVLMKLSSQEATVDPFAWSNVHTMQIAHLWITQHFDNLKNGDVVDTRVILGEADKPAEPEIWTPEKAAEASE